MVDQTEEKDGNGYSLADLERASRGVDRAFSDVVLPTLMLQDLLRSDRPAVQIGKGECVIVTVPYEDWIQPIVRAAGKLGMWDEILGVAKRNPRDTHDKAFRMLAGGKGVFCVSHAPEAMLPRALLAVADLNVRMESPDSATIRKVITLVTGKRCGLVPEGLAAGLDFTTITACIRAASRPAQCIARLAAASRSGSRRDPTLRTVPTLGELAGYGEAMDWCKRLAADVELWRLGGLDFANDIERTAVFASEPGLGKTTLVRSLAKTTGLPLFATSVGTWFSQTQGYLDSVIKEIDALFAAATKASPAIVFIDEIESIPNRATMDARNASWWTPVIGHLLTTLDGAASGSTSRLVIIGATNHPEKLDAALTRAGRLSPVIHIGRPGKADLAVILRQHLGDDLADIDLDGLAGMALGASGADVVAWTKGARARVRAEGRSLTGSDLADQIAPVAGIHASVLQRIAWHEAGHAVAATVLGVGEVTAVSLSARGGRGGATHVEFDHRVLTQRSSEALVMFLLAGMCSETAFAGSPSSGAGGSTESDLARATELVCANHVALGLGASLAYRGGPEDTARLLSLDPRLLAAVEGDLQRLRCASQAVVDANRRAVAELSEFLLEHRTVSGEIVKAIVAKNCPGVRGHG